MHIKDLLNVQLYKCNIQKNARICLINKNCKFLFEFVREKRINPNLEFSPGIEKVVEDCNPEQSICQTCTHNSMWKS